MRRHLGVLGVLIVIAGVLAPATAQQRGRGRKVPQGVKAIREIEYAKVAGKSLKLDLYVPRKAKTPGKKPRLLVWIHGGAWRMGSKAGINPSFLGLTADGYAAASIDYRLNGLQAHPEHIHDCKGAIRWLRANAAKYGYDASRIGVGGGSAGGHLVLLLGTSAGVKDLEGDVGGNLDQSSRVQAVVDLFGPADFELWWGKTARFRDSKIAKRLKSASPVTYVTDDDAPILVFHGDKDPIVPLLQSQSVHKRYQKAGLESALHVIKGAGHGGGQFSDNARSALVKAFLDRHIKQIKKSR
jgi:acetyl esterase/lipase